MAGSWAELLQRCSPFLGSHTKGGSRITDMIFYRLIPWSTFFNFEKTRRQVWLVLQSCKTILIHIDPHTWIHIKNIYTVYTYIYIILIHIVCFAVQKVDEGVLQASEDPQRGKSYQICNIQVSHVCRKAVKGNVFFLFVSIHNCLNVQETARKLLVSDAFVWVPLGQESQLNLDATGQVSNLVQYRDQQIFKWPNILCDLRTCVGFGFSSAAAEQRCSLANQWLQFVKGIAVCVFV